MRKWEKVSVSSQEIGLSGGDLKRILACLKRFEAIETVILYGSRAKGNFRPGSDIDLCLFGSRLSSQDLTLIDNFLDDLMLPYQIDLSIYQQIDNPDFKEHIDRVGLRLG